VARRFAAPGLAFAALIVALAGGRGLALLVLLVAIGAGSVRLLDAVGAAAVGRCDRFPVVMSVVGLVFLVAAGVTRMPILGLGLLACVALELVGEVGMRSEFAGDTPELADAPVSRAA
jgi:hypothetical protein